MSPKILFNSYATVNRGQKNTCITLNVAPNVVCTMVGKNALASEEMAQPADLGVHLLSPLNYSNFNITQHLLSSLLPTAALKQPATQL